MDPFTYFPHHICDQILEYLKLSDLKQASLVSWQWYEYIGNSKNCMKNVIANYSEQTFNDMDAFIKSKRIYQKLHFWIKNPSRQQMKDFRTIVKKWSNTLRYIGTMNDVIEMDVDLPNLKELLLYNERRDELPFYENGILSKAINIEKLSIHSDSRDANFRLTNPFVDLLGRMHKLKSLEICDARLLMHMNAENCQFQLDEFYFSLPVWVEEHWLQHEIIHNFLLIHKSTLKIIKYLEVSFEHLEFLLTEFPMLHTLMSNIPEANHLVRYRKNVNIKSFHFISRTVGCENISYKILWEMCPNIQTFIISALRSIDINLDQLIPNLKSLTKIGYHFATLNSTEYYAKKYPRIVYVHHSD